MELRTPRLILRRWRDQDRGPFASLNADTQVMEYYPSTLSSSESDAFVDRIESSFEHYGYGLWAVERIDSHHFIGYVGLAPATFEAHFTPAVEVGWRLASEHWGQGFATEAARATLADGFGRVGLAEIVSFTSTINLRSQRVMQRLRMAHDPDDDFDHPKVAAGHPLKRHVLYRLGKSGYQ